MVRTLLLSGLLSTAATLSAPAVAEPWSCPAAVPFTDGTGLIRAIHVYAGIDGVSHIEKVAVKGFTVPFFDSGHGLTQTVLGPSQKVVIVHGPPNATIPVRAGIGRVMFLTLQGSTTVVLPTGEEATASPGDLMIFDDEASKTGHGGRTGECGYVALSVAIPRDAPTFAAQR